MPLDPSLDRAALAEAFASGVASARLAFQGTEIGEVIRALDRAIETALARLPVPVACTKGCVGCCFHPPFITALEWKCLFDDLKGLSEAELAPVIDAVERIRPLLPELLEVHAALRRNEPLSAITVQCPLLIDGACSVYAARPLVCRGFGSTTFPDAAGRPLYFASPLAAAHARRSLPQTFELPPLKPFLDRAEALTREAGGTTAMLPLWLFAHVSKRGLVDAVDLTPSFETLAS